MVFSLSGCFISLEDNGNSKTYYVGDTQKVKGISITVTNVESGLYCDNKKSSNGWWVKVHFTATNDNDEPYKIFYSDFELNDTYTIRKTSYSLTNIKSGGFEMIKGNTYEFFVIFDCKYQHSEKDMIFMWDRGLFYENQEWVV